MIRNEAEYRIASSRLIEARNRLVEHRASLKSTNMSDEEIKRVIDPIESFHLQLKEEVESYERLRPESHECPPNRANQDGITSMEGKDT
jgi:hypothetical protein